MRVILASSSITRRKIMDELNIKYDIITSDIEERSQSSDPKLYVEELSRNKALSVSSKVDDNKALIIAADTIIYKDGKKYEKPKTIEEVIANLKELSGAKNQGITGVTIFDTSNGNSKTFSCTTDVYFKTISEEDIMWYVSHEKDLLKKAGYSLEGTMSLFLEKIDGDYYNVLGLPLGMLYSKINEMGYSLKDLE
ncbi:MAG: nucleoside triphosphate pyrophosphatase [Clostridia bacterium]